MFKQRLEHAYETMQTDALLITSKANIFYYTNFYYEPHERFVAIWLQRGEKPVFICPTMELPFVGHLQDTYTVIGYGDEMNPYTLLQAHLVGEAKSLNVGVETTHLTVHKMQQLEKMGLVNISAADDWLMNQRARKDAMEIGKMKEACELADWAIAFAVDAIEEGKSELALLGEIEYALKRQGVRAMSFDTIVLTGKNSALPHGTSGRTTISRGDFVLFDLGVIVDGYCSDITRTVCFGQASNEQKLIYNTVLRAQQAAIDAVRIGQPLGSIDVAARSVIEEAGYGPYFPHRIGHGLGVLVHEPPSMDQTNTTPITEGLTFTIEPGVYVPNVGGVRIEDDLYVSAEGVEILTNYPKQLIELD
ncbi:MAG: M24 family metallopeptidase [Bacilli bacterium]